MNALDAPTAGLTAQQSSIVITRVLQPIRCAQARVERECREVAAEQQAFKQFADRVAAIKVTRPVSLTAGGRTVLIGGEAPEPMAQIQDAYQETVMAVDHCDREYGEALQTHLGAELGTDVATAVCEGAAHLFTPHFKAGLVTTARQAQQNRTDFLKILDTEVTSLTEAHETLCHLVTQLEDHTTCGSMTVSTQHGEAIISQLETLVTDRQQLLSTRSQPSLLTGHDVCTYLYDAEDWTYPVLWAAAVLRELVEARQR